MLEKLLPLKLPPGLYRNGTKYQAKGRWYDANLVRFYEGAIRPVQGWRVAMDNNNQAIPSLVGIPRAALGWRSATGEALVAVATTEKLYVIKNGTTYDITPVDFTGGNANAGSGGNGDYGNGAYGAGLYGIGRAPLAASLTDADTWQLDAFGDVLVACCTNGGRIYVWTGDTSAPAVVATSSPEPNRGVVITPERFVVALGSEDDVRKVYWSAQADYEDWDRAQTADNSAGDFTLSTNGRIMCGRRTKAQTLIFTDADMHSMNYIGGTFVYSIKQEGDNCGIISPQGVAIVDTAAIWMGRDNFYSYDGFVKPVPCEVHDHVFGSFNAQQASKVFACPVSEFSEIWWFYPSAGSAENDRYVVYNYREQHWTTGKLGRTAAIDRGALPQPVMFDSNGTIYVHEDAAGTRTVAPSTLLSDSLEDDDATTLQDHTPDGSVPFAWAKVAGDDLVFDTNTLRRDGSTRPYYAADVALSTDDYSVSVVAHIASSPFASDNVGGVGARMAGGASKAGYYFVVRTDTPTFRLMGLDASGAAIFTELQCDVPASLLGQDITLKLLVNRSTITGYANGIQMLQTTDTTYTTGKAGLVGSWPSAATPTGYADSFTEASITALESHTPDGTSSFAWTKRGTIQLDVNTSGQIVQHAGGDPTDSRYTANADPFDTPNNYYTVQGNVDVISTPGSSLNVVLLLLSNAVTPLGYRFVLSINGSGQLTFAIGTITGGGFTPLGGGNGSAGPFSLDPAGTYVMELRKNGSNIEGYWNGVKVVYGTDNTYTPTLIGIEAKTSAVATYRLSDIGAGGSTPSPNLGMKGDFEVTGTPRVEQTNLESSGDATFDPLGNVNLIPYLESGPIELGDGDTVMRVQRVVPDEKNLGDVELRFFGALFPTATETEYGPYTATEPTPVRFTARQVRVRVEEAVAGEDWRLGVTRLGVIPGGRR